MKNVNHTKSVEVVRIYNDRTKFKIKSNRLFATDFEKEVFQELMKLKQLDYLSGVSFPLYFWYDRETEIVDLKT